jgi:regulator of protease activity HflC (stomatin/prohibitin superfamily)
MKTIAIAKNQRGLIFNNGQLIDVIQAGTHVLFWNKTVQVVNAHTAITATSSLFVELNNNVFNHLFERFEIDANQLLLRYLGKNIIETYTAGTYLFWKSEMNFSYEIVEISSTKNIESIDRSVLESALFLERVHKVIVPECNQLVVFVNGAYHLTLSANTYYFWKNANVYSFRMADLRIVNIDVQGQELLTKDKTSIRVNFSGQYKIVNVYKAMVENSNYYTQMYAAIQLAIREIIGAQTLDQLLETKTELSHLLVERANGLLTNMGLELVTGGLKDIILPGDVKEILNKVLIAEKQAQANMIMRREETATTRNLLNTARLMEENEMLYKLKEMEFVERIAEKIDGINIQAGSNISEQLKTLFTK